MAVVLWNMRGYQLVQHDLSSGRLSYELVHDGWFEDLEICDGFLTIGRRFIRNDIPADVKDRIKRCLRRMTMEVIR